MTSPNPSIHIISFNFLSLRFLSTIQLKSPSHKLIKAILEQYNFHLENVMEHNLFQDLEMFLIFVQIYSWLILKFFSHTNNLP